MTILLLGGNGQVGSEILGQAKMQGLDVVAPARSELDITSTSALERLFKRDDWSVVINAAAYTNVDGAEDNPDVAFQINAFAPAKLSELAALRQIPIVHI
jgi:dTDP-4-dehydrorhamnose reductase